MAWIIAVGLLARGIFFFSTPILEDDYYRYLWDGAVTASGINPYSYSPDEALEPPDESGGSEIGERARLGALAAESGNVAERINHPRLRTIYPPVAQGAFALSYSLKPWSLTAWRAVLLLFDVATMLLVLAILRSLGLPLVWVLIYWWNPLLIRETINGAHMDVIAIPFALAAMLLAIRSRFLLASASLALAMGAKLWPATLAPILLRPLLKNPKKLAAALCIIAVAGAAMFVPIYAGGLDKDSGFTAYGKGWEMNDALFMVFVSASRGFMKIVGIEPGNAQIAARGIVLLLICAWVGLLARGKIESGIDLGEKCLFIAAAIFLLSPTQFPWYFIWVLPFLAIRPRASLLMFTALLPLHYLRFYFKARGDVGIFDNGIVWIEFVPVWLMLAWEFWRSRTSVLTPEPDFQKDQEDQKDMDAT
jgi:hypothetical protein